MNPAVNEVTIVIEGRPGMVTRRHRAGTSGTLYGITREPDALFALHPDGSIDDLGLMQGYTTSLALSPDGSTLYYVPHAHGRSAETSPPLVAVDTSTGRETVLLTVNAAAEEKLGPTRAAATTSPSLPTGRLSM